MKRKQKSFRHSHMQQEKCLCMWKVCPKEADRHFLMFYITRCACLHTLRTVGIMDVHQEISRSMPLIAVSVTVLQHNKIILEILH